VALSAHYARNCPLRRYNWLQINFVFHLSPSNSASIPFGGYGYTISSWIAISSFPVSFTQINWINNSVSAAHLFSKGGKTKYIRKVRSLRPGGMKGVMDGRTRFVLYRYIYTYIWTGRILCAGDGHWFVLLLPRRVYKTPQKNSAAAAGALGRRRNGTTTSIRRCEPKMKSDWERERDRSVGWGEVKIGREQSLIRRRRVL